MFPHTTKSFTKRCCPVSAKGFIKSLCPETTKGFIKGFVSKGPSVPRLWLIMVYVAMAHQVSQDCGPCLSAKRLQQWSAVIPSSNSKLEDYSLTTPPLFALMLSPQTYSELLLHSLLHLSGFPGLILAVSSSIANFLLVHCSLFSSFYTFVIPLNLTS